MSIQTRKIGKENDLKKKRRKGKQVVAETRIGQEYKDK